MGFKIHQRQPRRVSVEDATDVSKPQPAQPKITLPRNPFSRIVRGSKKNRPKISKATQAFLQVGSCFLSLGCHTEEEEDLTETASISTSTCDSIASAQPNLPQQQPRTFDSSCPLALVNLERAQYGLRPLRRSYELEALAKIQVEALASDGAVHHTDDLPDRLGNPLYWGENVAVGESIDGIHRAMIRSVTESQNITDPHFRQMGVATVKGSNDQVFLCQLFR